MSSKTFNTKDDDVKVDDKQGSTSDTKKNSKFKRQGKGSRQKQQDKFRKRISTKVDADYHQKLAEKFGMLGNDSDGRLESVVTAIQVSPQMRAVPLSVSTRAVGIVTAITYERTTTTWNAEALAPIATIHQVFRVHTWLVYLKIYLAQQIQVESQTLPGALRRLVLSDTIREQLLAVSQVPSGFAAILDCIGKVVTQDSTYHMGIANLIEEGALPTQVFADTLRATVVMLSTDNAETLEARQNYIVHNSIPGARFVNNLLLNPDEVWPDNADQLLAADIHSYKNWLTRVETRLPKHFTAPIVWSGEATAGGLVSSEIQSVKLVSSFTNECAIIRRQARRTASGSRANAEEAIYTTPRYKGYTLVGTKSEFWFRDKLNHTAMVLGMASMCGEVCGIETRHEISNGYALSGDSVKILYDLTDAPR